MGKSKLTRWRSATSTRTARCVWVNLTVSLLREDTGEPGYFIAVVEDITDRKLTEEQYRTFFAENVSPVFWIEMKNPIPD